jgi:hypothetical protein
MSTPALALAWELWRRHRWGNIATLAAIPVCSLLYITATKLSGRPLGTDLLAFALLPMVVSLLWTFSVFGFTESDARRGFTGIPVRVWTLPVRTRFVVTCLTLFGALTIAALYIAWAELVFAPAGFPLPVRFPAVVLATAMVFFQAVVWGLASFPWLRAFVLVGGAAGFLVLNIIGLSGETPWARSETARLCTVLAFLPLAYGAALFGVQAERRGGWQAWPWLRRLLASVAAILPRQRAPFASDTTAQLWFEWRRKGWFLTVALAASIASVTALLPIAALMEPGAGLPVVAFATTSVYPLLLAGIAGLGLAKSDFWSKEVALHPFQALRPMSSTHLVILKLQTAARITLLGGLLGTLLSWLLTLLPKWRELWEVSQLTTKLQQWLPADRFAAAALVVLTGVTAVAMIWKAMVDNLRVGLTGRGRTIQVRAIAGGVFLLALLSAGAWFCRQPERFLSMASLVYASATLLLIWKSFDTLRAFRDVARAQLLTGRGYVILWAIWLGLAASLAGWALLLWLHTDTPRSVLVLAVAWLWPGGALGHSLLKMLSNRHR